MANRRNTEHALRCLGVAGLTFAAVLSLAGCAETMSGGSGIKAAPSMSKSGSTSVAMEPTSMKGSSTASPDAQACSACAGKGMAPMVVGTVATMNGMQIVDIGVKNGYYSPNQFEAKAGVPIKVVFSGQAKGCLAKPQFKSLGKGADFTTAGSAAIELGALTPGTYEFACGMGMTGGKIVVK
jgi:maltose-binding protein MalE